jgi:anti-sigma-K factor RskA
VSTDPCASIRELLPAYALGALDADERRLVDSHLPACPDCQAALAEFRAVEQGLLHATPTREPPARIRAGLIARLAETRPPVPVRRRRWGSFAAGLALTVLLALNLLLAGQLRQAQAQQAALAEQLAAGQLALELLSHAGTRTHAAAGESASGSLIVNTTANTAVLSAKGLIELDAQHVYQLWLIPAEGQPVSIGLFQPRGQAGAFILPIQPEHVLADFAGFGITIEPAAGSPTPTGPLVLTADL